MKKVLKALLFLTIILFAFFATIKLDLYIFSGDLNLIQRILEDIFFISAVFLTTAVLSKIFKTEYRPSINFIVLLSAALLYFLTMIPTTELAISLVKPNHHPDIEKTRIEIISIPSLINAIRIENFEAANLEPLTPVSNYKFNNVIANTDNGKSFYYINLDREKNSFTLVQIFCTLNATTDIITSTKYTPKKTHNKLGYYEWDPANGKNLEIDEKLGEIILTLNFNKHLDSKDIQRWIVGTLAFGLYTLFYFLIFNFINKTFFTEVKQSESE